MDDVTGVRCQAPYRSEWLGTQYYNAMISATTGGDGERPLGGAEVLFLTPVCEKMKTCDYHLEGTCTRGGAVGSEDECRWSHGHRVAMSELRCYRPRDYERDLRVGAECLVRHDVTGIWGRGRVDKVGATSCLVSHRDRPLTVDVAMEDVVPLCCGPATADKKKDDDGGYKVVAVPCERVSDVTKGEGRGGGADENVGAWEAHTRGIGSRIMGLMGFVRGDGLGSSGQGRKLPVPIRLLPPGKSLDYIANQKVKKEKVKQQRHHAAATSSGKRGGDVFNFMNKLFVPKKKTSLPPGGAQGKAAASDAASLVKKLESSVVHLAAQVRRNEKSDPSAAKRFGLKLKRARDDLSQQRSHEAAVTSQRQRVKSYNKMMKF